MINLATLFENPFEGTRLSEDKFKSFTEDHIHRIAAGNSEGLFSTLLVNTTDLYNNYFGGVSDKALHAAVQKSLTNANDLVFDDFLKYIRRHEGMLRSKFGVTAPQYMEFLPLGLTEYNNANKGNIEKLMIRFASAALKYKSEVGPELVNDIDGFVSNFKSTRNAQLGKISELGNTKQGTAEARTLLEIQILKNIYTIGLAFTGNVDKCIGFFNQSIIRAQTDSNKDGVGNVTGVVTSGGQPLINVKVEITDRNLAVTTTDTDGKYRTRSAEIGLAKMKFSKEGYLTLEIEVDILDAGDTTLNVELQKA